MRYFLHLGYNGYGYHGWQKQRSALGVQAVLEAVMQQVLKIPIAVVSCGRTDAQVHASQFFCHFDLNFDFDYDLIFRLNKTLPPDIAIFDVLPMEGAPHARFDAIQRRYNYFIHRYKDPFLAQSSAGYLYDLSLSKMQEAVALLPNYRDFYAFCKSPNSYEHTICHVSSAQLYTNPAGDKLRFEISANRFLTGMIRIIVQKLLDIGTGRLSVVQFEHYLREKQVPPGMILAYPQGLYLSKVTYPYLDLPARVDLSRAEEWLAVSK